MNMLNIKELGQVFTPQYVVSDMMSLIKNNGRFLEPSCGNGAFFRNLPANKIGIEIDKNVINDQQILNIDFFDYPINEKFDTIIGNPPYVKYKDIKYNTKFSLQTYSQIFDERSNLYLFFIYKCILHL
ncbi:TPA: class I SAM-dependent methyltransferase, partial [Campylobacter lari]|nr:class I SAM-dependent methyltransferase [Campylobacter lari]